MRIFHLYFAVLGLCFIAGHNAFSQSSGVPLVNNVQDDERIGDKSFMEARMAAQNFIDYINEARKELTISQNDLARQKVLAAENLLPLIARATPAQRRLTRVEFGGGLYADSLGQRKIYAPIETQYLENLTRSNGQRRIKSTGAESDATIIYISLDLTGNKAQTYLDQIKQDLAGDNLKQAAIHLEELSDQVIKINDAVPTAIQARDYIMLADNYIRVGNFFGARHSLKYANGFLENMKSDDFYKSYRSEIIALHRNIDDLQMEFANLDANQIKNSELDFKNSELNWRKWGQQISGWTGE